jgi:hypothetical protein
MGRDTPFAHPDPARVSPTCGPGPQTLALGPHASETSGRGFGRQSRVGRWGTARHARDTAWAGRSDCENVVHAPEDCARNGIRLSDYGPGPGRRCGGRKGGTERAGAKTALQSGTLESGVAGAGREGDEYSCAAEVRRHVGPPRQRDPRQRACATPGGDLGVDKACAAGGAPRVGHVAG